MEELILRKVLTIYDLIGNFASATPFFLENNMAPTIAGLPKAANYL